MKNLNDTLLYLKQKIFQASKNTYGKRYYETISYVIIGYMNKTTA